MPKILNCRVLSNIKDLLDKKPGLLAYITEARWRIFIDGKRLTLQDYQDKYCNKKESNTSEPQPESCGAE